ncbi:MAG TPA: glycosyl hydrolase, partial [Anseongella sp.]
MHRSYFLLAFLLAMLAVMPSCSKQESASDSFSRMKEVFQTVPDSIQTSVYWYWISDHVSKEGVVKDLHAMKEVGINRAFIGNMGLTGKVPYGDVTLFSDTWWEAMHAALKTAGELGIDIGIFNSPGWSQSGGPWVKSEQAMRYLTASETLIHGGEKVHVKLPRPEGDFQDVRVLAFPAPEDYGSSITGLHPESQVMPALAG